MFAELITEALRNLMRHKLRSLLTALGIIFGIASVVSMVSAGEGARREILEQIRELGTSNIIVNAKKPPAEQNAKKAEGTTCSPTASRSTTCGRSAPRCLRSPLRCPCTTSRTGSGSRAAASKPRSTASPSATSTSSA
jgi:hypothetical protein